MDSCYISPIEAVSMMVQENYTVSKTELSGFCNVKDLTNVPFKVIYDKDLKNGEDCIKDSFISDGTLWFEMESIMKIMETAVGLSATRNKTITIGKIKISNEYYKGTKNRPWLTLKTTCEMPYIINEGDC